MRQRSMMVAMVLVGTVGTAWAGTRSSWPVVVDVAGRVAYGALGTARNSRDTAQLIGCASSYNGISGKEELRCQARDAAGTYVFCSTDHPVLVGIGHALNGDSFLQFNWDESGFCTYVRAENQSDFEPKR